MNHNVYGDGYGFGSDSAQPDNSVNYLRRLKEQTVADNPSAGTGPTVRNGSSHGKERRRSPRYKCTGSAELTQEGSRVRMWGTLTDISLRGCYVETSTPFPINTKLDLVLDVAEIRFRARGEVRISYPFLGMGILLTDLEPDQRTLLEQLLATLARATTIANPLVGRELSAADKVAAADPMLLLQEIRRFFDKNGALSREEFLRIAERCQRT